MLSYETLPQQVKRIIYSTLNDGDKYMNGPKVYEALAHNLNDRRYVPVCLSGIGNGHGDTTLVMRIGKAVIEIDACGWTSTVYYEKDSDYCWNPKRKEHTDIKVKFLKWEY